MVDALQVPKGSSSTEGRSTFCTVGKKPLPFNWVDSDGSWLVQALRNDYIAEGAIQPSHFDHIKALVSPVNISYKNTGMQISYMVLYLYLCNYVVWTSILNWDFKSVMSRPAIQSTVMPSTLPMPLVTTSSLHVWSLLALLMVLSPMSTQ